jgi:ADP-dependent NAD(P)H-hydrate dehydratase / NAD(P)H-hydrate epimerase
MQPVLTPAEMGEADRRTIEAGTPVEVLMERAGRAVAWAVRRGMEGTYGRRVVVVCGKGNNGGDGLVAARALRNWGARVDAFTLDGGVDRQLCERALLRADAFVDAMFGTGFGGSLEGDAAWVARAADAALGQSSAPCVAVDIPSGVNGHTGQVDGEAVRASHTVTFSALKPGLLFEPGASHTGAVEVADIGIDIGRPALFVPEALDVALELPERDPQAHKWLSGLLVVGGSGGMTGAPSFVSHAAMRAGAGIVWCSVPGAEAAARASGTEVITKALSATPEGALDEPAAAEVLKAVDRFRALVVGPGLGRDDRTAAAVRRIVAEAAIPLVLDADGLNALDGDVAPLRARTAPAVLTPHAGEYVHLAGEKVGPDRVAAARRLSERAHAVVLLKGPGEVIAHPRGGAAINTTGGPWLATAGTGDVLSGIIGGFLARGAKSFWAATGGAFTHGRAADVAGHTGLVAGDLIPALPAAIRSIESLETPESPED